MIQYPMKFDVSSVADPGITQVWNSEYSPSEGDPVRVVVAVPPEFEGPGGGFSPEDFFALALANCFVATFKVIAEKSKLIFQKLDCKGTLTVESR